MHFLVQGGNGKREVKREALKRSDKSDKSDGCACPVWGNSMLLRRARKGPKAGESFWGCSGFPDCRGILPVNQSDK